MLRKIIILQSTSMCWAMIGPTTLKCSCRANNSNSTVETLVLDHCWTDVRIQTTPTNTYPMLAPRLLAILVVCVIS